MFEMIKDIGWSLLREDGEILVWMVLDQGVGLELGWRGHSNISMTLGSIVAILGCSGRKIRSDGASYSLICAQNPTGTGLNSLCYVFRSGFALG